MQNTQSDKPGCLFLVLSFFSGRSPSKSIDELPYDKHPFLLSKAERSFFGVLEKAVGGSYRIFAKVRLADLIKVRSNTESRQSYFNKIQAKHIDFVLCDPDYISPVAAVELDDSSHNKQSRKDRDQFVDDALSAAGLPIIRFRVKKSYFHQEVAATINRALEPSASK